MDVEEAEHLLERLTPTHMPPGTIVEAINVLILHHSHRIIESVPALTGTAIIRVPGSHEEAPEHVHGPECSNEPENPPEGRRRPGKTMPTAEQVLERAQAALVEAGITGYAPLSVTEGIRRLAEVLRQTREQLTTAQASTRQHLEASSHRAQIADQYCEALFDFHRAVGERVIGTPAGIALNDVMIQAYRAATTPPEWDKRIRP